MAKRVPLTFTDEDLQMLSKERYEHPDPRVQRRMEVLWLISQGLARVKAAKLAGLTRATAERYVVIYRARGVAGLRHFDWHKPVSELEQHRESLEESFQKNPPHTVAEAAARIKEETGLERKPTQVRSFLKSFGFEMALYGGHSVAAQEDGGGAYRHTSKILGENTGTVSGRGV